MNKLNKAQEKRFDEKFVGKEAKQHLANELALERKKMVKKLEKLANTFGDIDLKEAIHALKRKP